MPLIQLRTIRGFGAWSSSSSALLSSANSFVAFNGNRLIAVARFCVFVFGVFYCQRSVSAMATVSLNAVRTSAAGSQTAPLLVLVHGLDSSSHTWASTIEALKDEVNCLAVDQRGCGFSPLGDIADFSQDALVDDLHHAVQKTDGSSSSKLIMLGHSLGGRVVMGYAAKYPKRVAACIVEDMDIEPRQPSKHAYIQLRPYDSPFERRRTSKDAMIQAFLDVGYPQPSIDRSIASGRITEDPNTNDGSWWSQVNPDFRKFCYPHVLGTEQGKADCKTLAKHPFPCHVMVAGEKGTVCTESSVQEMKSILGDQLTVHRFPEADHSIHGSDRDRFVETLRSIIQSVQ